MSDSSADGALRAALAIAPLGTDELQRELAELARGYFDKVGGADERDRARHGEQGGSPHFARRWQTLAAEQGWQAFGIAERFGGAGLGLSAMATVLNECGRVLAYGELLGTGVLGAYLLETSEVREAAEILSAIAAGDTVVAIPDGFGPPGAQPGASVTAAAEGAEWHVTGRFAAVLDAPRADLFLVPATTPDGVALFAVRADQVAVEQLAVLDLTRTQGAVSFAAAAGRLIHPPGGLGASWDRARDRATVALAAEQTGGAARCLELTLSYLHTREQFGRPIGSFQALKHRCADMYLELEAARSASDFAVWAASTDDPCLPIAASIAKSAAGDAYRLITEETVQLHGGIGFTWEHDAHLYFRRAAADDVLLGTSAAHRGRTAALLAG